MYTHGKVVDYCSTSLNESQILPHLNQKIHLTKISAWFYNHMWLTFVKQIIILNKFIRPCSIRTDFRIVQWSGLLRFVWPKRTPWIDSSTVDSRSKFTAKQFEPKRLKPVYQPRAAFRTRSVQTRTGLTKPSNLPAWRFGIWFKIQIPNLHSQWYRPLFGVNT